MKQILFVQFQQQLTATEAHCFFVFFSQQRLLQLFRSLWQRMTFPPDEHRRGSASTFPGRFQCRTFEPDLVGFVCGSNLPSDGRPNSCSPLGSGAIKSGKQNERHLSSKYNQFYVLNC